MNDNFLFIVDEWGHTLAWCLCVQIKSTFMIHHFCVITVVDPKIVYLLGYKPWIRTLYRGFQSKMMLELGDQMFFKVEYFVYLTCGIVSVGLQQSVAKHNSCLNKQESKLWMWTTLGYVKGRVCNDLHDLNFRETWLPGTPKRIKKDID